MIFYKVLLIFKVPRDSEAKLCLVDAKKFKKGTLAETKLVSTGGAIQAFFGSTDAAIECQPTPSQLAKEKEKEKGGQKGGDTGNHLGWTLHTILRIYSSHYSSCIKALC
jgi:hypothetical protein